MKKVNFVWLAVAIIIGLVWYLTYPPRVKKAKITRYEYTSPPVLVDNAEWQSLIDGWRALQKLDSWTPEYSRAEIVYNRRLRKFLWTDLDNPNIVDIPIVALAMQNAGIFIDLYHDRIGDLGYSKASSEASQILKVIYDDDFPDEIEEIVNKFHDLRYLIDDEGVESVKERLSKAKSEIGLVGQRAITE